MARCRSRRRAHGARQGGRRALDNGQKRRAELGGRTAGTCVRPTRIATLVAVAVAVGIGLWVIVRVAYAVIPPLPWTTVAVLVLVTIVELVLAWAVWARINRRPGAPMLGPLVIARYVALAKASAYASAVAAGAFGGLLAYLLDSLSSPTQQADAWVAGASMLASCALCVTAMLLEYACRVPKDPDDEDRKSPANTG
ncbi:MAG: DUF3180 family protein [Streptosporangiales bacterium]|nr:DUF3180 family protein [Streptosporangiales bacterium]